MTLPLLVSKKEGMKIFKEDYKIGWLMTDEKQGMWRTFASCKDLELAYRCVKEIIKDKGYRKVYISDIPLDKFLTLEQVRALRKLEI